MAIEVAGEKLAELETANPTRAGGQRCPGSVNRSIAGRQRGLTIGQSSAASFCPSHRARFVAARLKGENMGIPLMGVIELVLPEEAGPSHYRLQNGVEIERAVGDPPTRYS